MASYVLTDLAGLQVQTEPVVNFDMDHYHILHQRLIEHEELLYGTAMQVQVQSLILLTFLFDYNFNKSCAICNGNILTIIRDLMILSFLFLFYR
jgi:hypothetical protein